MKRLILLFFTMFFMNSCFALEIPKDFDLQEFLNRPYYGMSFETALSKQKPFLLVIGNTKYAPAMVRFIPIGEMVDKEFGSDFNFCLINTKVPGNEEVVELFKPKNLKQPSLYIVDTQKNKFISVDKKYYGKNALRKVLKKYLNGELM